MSTVATWNLENLFLPGGEFGPTDPVAYQAKLHALAGTVNELAPDVLGVQEVGDPAALAALVALLDGEWQTVLSEEFEAAHPIRVGVLSRLPLVVVDDLAEFAAPLEQVQADDAGARITRMGRGALAVRVTLAPSEELTIVACHLKSKLLTFPASGGRRRFAPHDEGERARVAAYALFRRAAEAVTVRRLTDRLLAGDGRARAVLVLGDLNDESQAATTQILYGPPGSELGTPGADRPDLGDGARLWNLAPRIPAEERFSRVYQGRRELIDHLLVSQALLARVVDVHVHHPQALASVTDSPASRRDAPPPTTLPSSPTSRRDAGRGPRLRVPSPAAGE